MFVLVFVVSRKSDVFQLCCQKTILSKGFEVPLQSNMSLHHCHGDIGHSQSTVLIVPTLETCNNNRLFGARRRVLSDFTLNQLAHTFPQICLEWSCFCFLNAVVHLNYQQNCLHIYERQHSSGKLVYMQNPLCVGNILPYVCTECLAAVYMYYI